MGISTEKGRWRITKWKIVQKLESKKHWPRWLGDRPYEDRLASLLGLGILRGSHALFSTPFSSDSLGFFWFWFLETDFSVFWTDWPDFGRVLKTLKARVSVLGGLLFLRCVIVNSCIDFSPFSFVQVSSVSLYQFSLFILLSLHLL